MYIHPQIKKEHGVFFLYIAVTTNKNVYVVNLKRHVEMAIEHFNNRIELISLLYSEVERRPQIPDIELIIIKFPIKIYTQHELRCKKYRESFINTFLK